MAPHSSTLAWKIPWVEEPGGRQSMGSLRVGHDWSDLAAAAAELKTKKRNRNFKPKRLKDYLVNLFIYNEENYPGEFEIIF